MYDCIIIGAGPAGLTAATYLARFRRHVAVLHHGNSRASYIPLCHNFPGWPEGISGTGLLEQLTAQLSPYQVPLIQQRVDNIYLRDGAFIVESKHHCTLKAKTIILATGTKDTHLDIKDIKQVIHRGLVRYCPICDAYEVIDKQIAVVGRGEHALREAIFLRNYTANICLFLLENAPLPYSANYQSVVARGIHIIEGKPLFYFPEENKIVIKTDAGMSYRLDAIYSAYGLQVNSELAMQLGALCDEEGFVLIKDACTTSVKGFYAIGDVAKGLCQISVAIGQAAFASTQVHNSLPEL
jgi:thioredoxin reductase (NADPH)